MGAVRRVLSNPNRPVPGSIPSLLELVERFLWRAEKGLAHRTIWLFSVGAAAVLQLLLILTHRPWNDEWQALLIARQTPTLASMFAQLHYEGHPQLWYLLLRGVGGLVPPRWILPTINIILAGVVYWTILARSPLRRVERLLLLLSEILLFEMLSVSRSLSLGVALIFVALALWKSRSAWLALALLPLCDFFFGVIGCALIAVRLRDRQDQQVPYFGLSLFALSSCIAASAVIPAKDVITGPARGLPFGIVDLARQIGTLMLPWQTKGAVPMWNRPTPVFIGLMLAPVFIWLCARSLRSDRMARWLLFGFIGILLIFSCAIYPIYFRHTALAAFLLIAFVWIRAGKGSEPDRFFSAWLLIGALCGIATAITNLLIPFDTASEAATVIRQQRLEKRLWFSYPAYWGVSLAAQSGIRLGDLEQDCSFQFMRWNFRSEIKEFPQLYAALRAARARHGSFYLVTAIKEPLPLDLARKVATVPAGYDGIEYNLWKIGDEPVRNEALEPCVPNLPQWQGIAS
jgi:hypothetical protein